MKRRSVAEARLLELALRLCESADLGQVLGSAYQHLSRSLSADYAALGVSTPGRPDVYEWHVAQIPEAFFQAHAQFLEHDFVRHAALKRPNVVLSDQEMITPAQLHRNPLYIRARELGVKLERVLAVMLDGRASWHGGFVLYRDGRTPFSEREQRELQGSVHLLLGAVRSSQRLQQVQARGDAFERLTRMRGLEVLLVDERGRELWRTPGLEALLLLHFAPTEVWVGSLPGEVAGALSRILRKEPPRASAPFARGSLRIEFICLPPGRYWAAVFQDLLPPQWREVLTKRQVEVAAGLVEGWDNQLIAEELGCSLETVRKHVQAVYDKLNVPGRTKLAALARELLGWNGHVGSVP